MTKKQTKLEFAKEYANIIRESIYKREFLIELQDIKGEDTSIFKENNEKDQEVLDIVEKYIKENSK